MKQKKLYLILTLSLFLFFTSSVSAHPGKTNSSGCHTCKTNCQAWGLNNYEYHCHDGNTYTNSNGQVFNSDGSSTSNTNDFDTTIPIPTPTEVPKSSDNTLKSITIDDHDIKISNSMTYTTVNKTIKITVKTNDSKATYHIENKFLKVGDNHIIIKVTAEDGTAKDYDLLVIREKLSNNKNLEVTINKKKVDFSNDKATINVSSDTTKLDYQYKLEDNNAKVEIVGNETLKFGDNEITFKVTAQDKTIKTYQLIVHRPTKTDEVIDAVLSFAIVGGIGYGIYYFIKKRKKCS